MLPKRLRLMKWYRGIMRPGQSSPLQILMIQATSFCNIDCKYCYLPFRSKKNRFDLSLIEPLFQKLTTSGLLGDQLTVVWHAGEPLVLPIEYYREAFSRIEPYTRGIRINHFFQTNGTLITPEYCDFIRDARVQIGVSIDGPAHVHDRNRVARSGRGTLEQTLRGIQLLKERRIAFTTISVLSAYSLSYPDEIFEFLRGLGPREIGFNVEEIEGINTESSLASEEFKQLHQQFMRRILELSLQPNAPRVREFGHAFNAAQGNVFGQTISSSEANPLSILSVGTDGRLTTYSPELLDITHPVLGDLAFATVSDVEFEKLFDNPRFATMNDEVQAGVKLCQERCSYFDVCGGGAPANKLAENRTFASSSTRFCEFRIKEVTNLAEDFLLERLQANRRKRQHDPMN
jgi:uncharacterized protein